MGAEVLHPPSHERISHSRYCVPIASVVGCVRESTHRTAIRGEEGAGRHQRLQPGRGDSEDSNASRQGSGLRSEGGDLALRRGLRLELVCEATTQEVALCEQIKQMRARENVVSWRDIPSSPSAKEQRVSQHRERHWQRNHLCQARDRLWVRTSCSVAC